MARNPLTQSGKKEASTSLLLSTRNTPISSHDGGLNDASFWPNHPRPLAISWSDFSLGFLPLVVVPVPFITLAVYMYQLNNQPISSHGGDVLDAMGVASTVWPIAFAAVIGALVRTIALFKAERGTSLGTLEVLLGSQTLTNTLKSPFLIRLLSPWTFFLFILWSISPLGGQAVLRTIYTAAHAEGKAYQLMYSPAATVGAPLNYGLWESASYRGTTLGTIVPMFGAALSAPSALGQAANGSSPNFDAVIERLGGAVVASAGARADLWGNVRVPEITSLPGYRSSDPHNWIHVPTDQLVNYESLVGIPLRGMPTDSPGNLTLQLSAAYLALECSPWFNTTQWLLDTKDGLWIHRYSNSSILREDNVGFGGGSPNVFMDIPGPNGGFNFSSKDITSKGNITQGTLVFGSAQNSTICDISHVYVDVGVECERSQRLGTMACLATQVRRSPGYKIPMPDTDLTALNGTGPAAIFAALPWLTPSYHNGYKSPFENYLADPAQGIEAGEVDEGVKDEYTSLSLEVFAQRLALIINTALRVSYYSPAMLGFSKVNLTAIAAAGAAPQYSYTYGNATGEFITTERRYWIQTSWMAMYMVSLILMILAIAAVLALRFIIRAPDFLTNVSALTRDSAYINVPAGGSTLAGEERARLLKDRRLRIRDVQPDQEFGYAALADDVGYESKKGLKLDGRVYA
ncbi:uncharacterized protein NECHADRAFT_77349 [Fusarium vanettenii 77-13-4]|uniref:Uncharacterized protein n=1 Tax=Fusarium vanettenii (strain ATCC MYA-4622 / CBS 123669 / FGSC 9596 / NRRL 45880 / 77-13-4) TaxID=660122 RepID=C7YKZ6_FUSV7|nr:uncharacterized protein NECHADRAFT_77349 [Fusarium vanettenii 77-13-4]EEU47163.1 hypothetical protein NECHADRAFT_77349 [Fusarium vanettenii 77-13-4]